MADALAIIIGVVAMFCHVDWNLSVGKGLMNGRGKRAGWGGLAEHVFHRIHRCGQIVFWPRLELVVGLHAYKIVE